MKPLELTIYPLDMTFPAGYKLPRDTRITFAAANRMAEEKRLTESELSAEYWRAERDYERLGSDKPAPGIDGWAHNKFDAWDRAAVIHRFIMKPHASERNYE